MVAATEQSYGRGVVLVVLAALGWSLSGVFVRHLPELDGWQINTWRGISTSLALIIYLLLAYGRDTPQRFRDIPSSAMVAAAGFFALGTTLYVTALTLASTANVACLAATAPIFTALLSKAVTGEPAGAGNWLATLIAVIGVGVVFWDGVNAGNLIGNALAIGVALSFACQMVTLRRYRGVDMVPAVAVGGLAVFVVAGFAGGFAVAPGSIAVLAVMGVVQLGVPLILFVRGARSVPAVTLSLIVLLDVVFNPLWAWLGAGERPTLVDALGGVIIMAAVALSVTRGGRGRPLTPVPGAEAQLAPRRAPLA